MLYGLPYYSLKLKSRQIVNISKLCTIRLQAGLKIKICKTLEYRSQIPPQFGESDLTKNYCIRLILVSYKKPKNMARLMYTTKCCSFAIYITKQASSEGTKHSFEKRYSLLSLTLPTFLLQIKFVKSWSSILNSKISDS